MAGLTTAFLLSKKPGYKIVVAAKHMPGDYDIEYASPWAGANYMPYVVPRRFRWSEYNTSRRVSSSGTEAAEWDKATWRPLEDLARNHPDAGVHFQGNFPGMIADSVAKGSRVRDTQSIQGCRLCDC